MEEQLQPLFKIFNGIILRIPDYQRGYAWQTKQLKDFWDDIIRLEEGKNHYCGVLTLENVPEKIYKKWEDDLWLLQSLTFKPFFVVDGQQRLTTAIILIQTILDEIGEDKEINYEQFTEIRKKYIYTSKNKGISRTYIFGYEKDNPSYEFLKTKIFNEHSATDVKKETLYTNNLQKAKDFFKRQLRELNSFEKTEQIFKKITHHFLFNVYKIASEIDVFVAFETMNNRGKPLSNLELLKNRLIYLSTLFNGKNILSEKTKLRANINECWKTIYEYLGKNKENPLPDDTFLRNHWIMYYKYSRKTSDDYIKFLLEEKFITNNISKVIYASIPIDEDLNETDELFADFENEPEQEQEIEEQEIVNNGDLTIQEINNYVSCIQNSVSHWYKIFNPYFENNLSDPEKILLDKLNRLSFGAFLPLLLAIYTKNIEIEKRIQFLKTVERYVFLLFTVSQRRSNTGDSEFFNAAKDLYHGKKTIDDVINTVNWFINKYFDIKKFKEYIHDKFIISKSGFYGWFGLRYFLYEYELELQRQSKTNNQKILWKTFTKYEKDFVTIEHILPQNIDKSCWKILYSQYNPDQLNLLKNSLGNLLPLSQPKNSSLQNDCFVDKISNKDDTIGYKYGSYSENEISGLTSWTTDDIKSRGIKMLEFMEHRWQISIGDDNDKINLLHLDFLTQNNE